MSGNPFGGPRDGNHDDGDIKIVCSMMLLPLRITGEARYCLMKLISILKEIAKQDRVLQSIGILVWTLWSYWILPVLIVLCFVFI